MAESEMAPQKHVAVGILILLKTAEGKAALIVARPRPKETVGGRQIFRRKSFPRVFQVTAHSRLDDGVYGPVPENADLKSFLKAVMYDELGPAAEFLCKNGHLEKTYLLSERLDEAHRIETHGLKLSKRDSDIFRKLLRTPAGSRPLLVRARDLERIEVRDAHPAEKETGDPDFDENGRHKHVKMFPDEFRALRKLLLEK